MSLDVYLSLDTPQPQSPAPRIFVREAGQTVQLTQAEWEARYPDRVPVMVKTPAETCEVYTANITHNLTPMATKAGLYQPLWRPEEDGITHAAQLIAPLRAGLARLEADPAAYEALTPANRWGDYAGLVRFVRGYLAACEAYPEATVAVWR